MTAIKGEETILVLDIGSRTTRAILFDIVDGNYRFVGKGTAATTSQAPHRNIVIGIINALVHLNEITSRGLLDVNQQLIIPSLPDGSGVDSFTVCISAGKPMDIVVVGLMDNYSGESALRLARSTYSKVKEFITLNDGRQAEERLNLIVQSRPDLIIAAGGTNSGASQSAIKLLETVGLACYILPETLRPDLLFAGNEMILEDIQASISSYAAINHAPNIRPSTVKENLEPARNVLADFYIQKSVDGIKGLDLMRTWAGKSMSPSADAFGRIVGFLSAVLKERKGVLGIDLGAAAAVVAGAAHGALSLSVFPQLGLCTDPSALFEELNPLDVQKWLTIEASIKDIKAYAFERWLHPGSIPGSPTECDIELALIRQVLSQAMKLAEPGIASVMSEYKPKMPAFEPILLSGSIFTHSRYQGRNALLVLDGVQPVGITTLIIDQNQIAPALGAAAVLNSLLTVQVLDSNVFMNAGTVIAPISNAKMGQPILQYKMVYDNGLEVEGEVQNGSLEKVALPYGVNGELSLKPLYGADIGMGAAGRGGKLIVKGGVFGLLIDARGRPLVLLKDKAERKELYSSWLKTIGDQ